VEQTNIAAAPNVIGISKDRLDVAIHPSGEVFVASGDAAGLDDLLTRLRPSVPGVGPTIARTLIAEMPELGTPDRRQIAALAGLAALDTPIRSVDGALLHRWRKSPLVAVARKLLTILNAIIRHKQPCQHPTA